MRQEFFEAAGDPVVRKHTETDKGELTEAFNDATEFAEGPPGSGGDDDNRAPDWKHRVEEHVRSHPHRRGHRPRRGKSYGYRQDTQ